MENQKQEYIGCLNTIIILWLVGGAITLLISIPFVLMSPMPGIAIGVVVCEIVSLVGLAFLLQFKKIGFYLFVGSYIVLLIAVLLVPELFELKWLFRILLGLLLFLILMAIKNKETKMNGYQTIGIIDSDVVFEDEEVINGVDQVENPETDTSSSEKNASVVLNSSTPNATSQNNDLELISNDDAVKTEKEEVKDPLASLVKEDENPKNEIIVNATKNESPESSPSVESSERADVDKRKPKNRKDWIIAAAVLAVVLLISGVVVSLSQCSRKTPDEIYKEAKALIDSQQYEKGIAELEKIQENYIPAKALLGHLYTMSDSVKRDMDRGKKLLWDAFEKNDTSAGSDLVHLYYVSANWDSIYQIAEKLTILNADKGYRALAWLHWTDKIGGEINKHKDYSKAEYYALQVADKDMYSCFYLGWMYDEGGFGIKKDYPKAFYWFKHGAELGDSYSCSNLGYMYLNGHGVNQSYKKAFESFKKAVSLDSANEHALYNIGCMFYDGQFVKANKDSAKLYFQKAAKYGNEAAAISLENDF